MPPPRQMFIQALRPFGFGSDRYDCFLLPNTLQHLRDIEGALHHALRLAADEGVRVVMTGEANDELCCGHGGMVELT